MRRALLALFLASGIAGGCSEPARPRGEVGAPAPHFQARTLEGEPITLAEFQGQPVLLNIWATWCPPCRKEMPELQALHDELGGRGLRIVGVSIDSEGSDNLVREFLDDHGITYQILRDPGDRASGAFRTQGVPTTVLIGRDGTVLWRRLGPFQSDDPVLRDVLENALAG